jgi:hypothetical protein
MEMNLIELVIDEDNDEVGVDAISLVESPAIEENFVALNNHKVEFKTIDEDKKIVVGLALVPEKAIYRRDGDKEYHIFFSKETVRKAAEMYLQKHNSNNATLEHQTKASGVSVVESWIVEDPKRDKTAMYGLNAVKGAWAVVMRITNDEIWKDVKAGTYKGLSIEGFFAEKEQLSKVEEKSTSDQLLEKIIAILNEKE